MANLSTGSSSSSEPYPCAYCYVDDILSFAELSDGSHLPAYAYHYDMTKIGRYFVEFEDGSIVSTKNRSPYVPLKPTDEYFRPVENPIGLYGGVCFNWDKDFPELKVCAGENAENNNVVQVFDTSPQRVTHTSQGETDEVSMEEETQNTIMEEETQNTAMANLSTGSSSSSEPYPCAYHYVDDILSFAELSDGSHLPAYAYHYDMTNIGRYFVEFEDGSIVSTKNRAPYVLLKPTDEYFRLVDGGVCFNWDKDFPELKVGGGENAENNNVVQVFDTSPQRATHTFQETEPKPTGKGDKKGVEVSEEQGSCVSSSGSASLCMDQIREELSCAICLEICFEPSTTSCGHSFCRECLRSAADICGTQCPKCRQLVSNGSTATVNTGLWNTIQLLFPKDVEERKAAGALNGGEAEHQSSVIIASHSNISRSITASRSRRRNFHSSRRQSSVNFRTRRESPSRDDDVEFAGQPPRELPS